MEGLDLGLDPRGRRWLEPTSCWSLKWRRLKLGVALELGG